MVSTVTSPTFDEAALEALPAAPSAVQSIRKQAFEEFRALPIPSQETEEWRYTDLSDFDLSFRVHVPGHNGHTAVAAHGSSTAMTTSNQDVRSLGVIFGDLDEAAEQHPELVEPHLHQIVPTNRTKFTALHGAFRTGGTFLYVPP